MTAAIETLLVLGASGDLAGRLLLPGIGQLMDSSEGPGRLTLIGAGSEQWDDQTWREHVGSSFASVQASGPRVQDILANTQYLAVDVTQTPDLQQLLRCAMARRRSISRCRPP